MNKREETDLAATTVLEMEVQVMEIKAIEFAAEEIRAVQFMVGEDEKE